MDDKNGTIIETQNLIKVYGKGDIMVRALDNVDIQINKGEFVAIMGPSGSGKSTLMNILGCLDRPTDGIFNLDGRDVRGLNKNELADTRNQKLGFIFQSFNLLPRLTALKNVMVPLVYNRDHGKSRAEQEQMAITSLESVGLGDRLHHRPNELSGGQRQRVAIARSLVNDPVLILADEPTGNLDTRSSYEIMGIMHGLHERGRTIVMVTHEPDIARQTERIICIRDGKVESDSQGDTSACIGGQYEIV
jgi:putative ABC transport system ATP-binding protein